MGVQSATMLFTKSRGAFVSQQYLSMSAILCDVVDQCTACSRMRHTSGKRYHRSNSALDSAGMVAGRRPTARGASRTPTIRTSVPTSTPMSAHRSR